MSRRKQLFPGNASNEWEGRNAARLQPCGRVPAFFWYADFRGIFDCCFRPAECRPLTFGREMVRRRPCPAGRAEFFLYEKMGRRGIVSAGSISEEGGRAKPVPTPSPPKTGIQGDLSPWQSARQRLAALPAALTLRSGTHAA